MAIKNNRPVVVIAGLVIGAGAIAFAASGIAKAALPKDDQAIFGISSRDSEFFFKRQAVWKEGTDGRHTVAPPRPEAAYFDYAISANPDTNKVCAVHAATVNEAALNGLVQKLSAQYGSPTAVSATSQRWSRGKDHVEIKSLDGTHQIVWDFTGSCFK